MLKDILKKVTTLLGRNDLTSELEKQDDFTKISSESIKRDIINLITHFNFIMSSIFEHYLDLEYCDRVASNSDCQISYNMFSFKPTKILKVEDESFYNFDFVAKCDYLRVCSPNKLFLVTYKFVPPPIQNLSDEVSFLNEQRERALCFGTASEFLCANGKFSEAKFWSDKMFSELFKIKTKKERLLKSTFCLWKKL